MFTEAELESIMDLANERADTLRGYVDTQRINGEAHFRSIAEKAEKRQGELIREKYYPTTPSYTDETINGFRVHNDHTTGEVTIREPEDCTGNVVILPRRTNSREAQVVIEHSGETCPLHEA